MSAILFLLLSVISSTSLNVIFKLFPRYGVNKLHAIVLNYLVCFILGWSLSEDRSLLNNARQEWFLPALLLGSLFIVIFVVMAQTVGKLGISTNAVSSKMAVIVPLLMAFLFLGEELRPLFGLGLLLSLLSIYFISIRKEIQLHRSYIWLPIIVFLGSGFIDSAIKLLEHTYGKQVGLDTMTYTIFLGAFLFGSLRLAFRKEHPRWKRQDLLLGIALGIPNYFSIFFLMSALAAFSNQSALVFAVNNASIVLLSTLLSVLFFAERLSTKNRWGLALSLISLLIIAYAH